MNPLLLDSEKSHLSVDMLFGWFGCIEIPECGKWLIRVCCLLNLPFNPQIF
jgi:hypothetical protein